MKKIHLLQNVFCIFAFTRIHFLWKLKFIVFGVNFLIIIYRFYSIHISLVYTNPYIFHTILPHYYGPFVLCCVHIYQYLPTTYVCYTSTNNLNEPIIIPFKNYIIDHGVTAGGFKLLPCSDKNIILFKCYFLY